MKNEIEMEKILLGEYAYTLPGVAGGPRVEAVSIDVPPYSERYSKDGAITEIGKKALADAHELIDKRRSIIQTLMGRNIRWVENPDNKL